MIERRKHPRIKINLPVQVKAHRESDIWSELERRRDRECVNFYMIAFVVVTVVLMWAYLLCGLANAQIVEPAEPASFVELVTAWGMVAMCSIIFVCMAIAPEVQKWEE